MKRFLIDLNVVLDVLLDRPGHAEPAAAIWAAAEKRRIDALFSAHGVTTVHYLAARHGGPEFARRVLSDLVSVFRIAPVDEAVILRALTSPSRDFVDAVCAAAAEAAACEAIVTRDPGGFPASPVPVLDPASALALIDAGGGPDAVSEPRPASGMTRAPRRQPKRGLRP